MQVNDVCVVLSNFVTVVDSNGQAYEYNLGRYQSIINPIRLTVIEVDDRYVYLTHEAIENIIKIRVNDIHLYKASDYFCELEKLQLKDTSHIESGNLVTISTDALQKSKLFSTFCDSKYYNVGNYYKGSTESGKIITVNHDHSGNPIDCQVLISNGDTHLYPAFCILPYSVTISKIYTDKNYGKKYKARYDLSGFYSKGDIFVRENELLIGPKSNILLHYPTYKKLFKAL